MSRIAKNPVLIAKGVEVRLNDGVFTAKGPKGELSCPVHPLVELTVDNGQIAFKPKDESRDADMNAGTMHAIIAGIVHGVSVGFEKKLTLVGVGFRAQAQGKKLNLSLGFSHPVVYDLPDGITAETPTQTEIVIKGSDKQKVGQVAAEVRGYRPPEPYKGKGIRYADEVVIIKETKKK